MSLSSTKSTARIHKVTKAATGILLAAVCVVGAGTLTVGSAEASTPNGDHTVCGDWKNDRFWQTSTSWARARERACIQNTGDQVRPVVQMQLDWPMDCSVGVETDGAGVSCPAGRFLKNPWITFHWVKVLPMTWSTPSGTTDLAGCVWGETGRLGGNNKTFTCNGPSSTTVKGEYSLRLSGVQTDQKDDGADVLTLPGYTEGFSEV